LLGKILGGAIGTIFGPVGTVVGVAVGHKLDSTIKNNDNSSNSSTSISSQSTFHPSALRGPYHVKGDVFALSLYFPISVDRELHSNDVFSKAISDMKFHYQYRQIPLFADSIEWFIRTTETRSEIDCIVTCPTSKIRSKQPLEMIASKVSELISLPYYKVLKKNDQYAKLQSYEGRREAARSITLTDSTNVKGKRVLLIDDIITSGSTMRASKERLLEGGAIDVLPLAVLTTADAYPPDKLELHPRSSNSGISLSQRIKESAVTLYFIVENGKSRFVYYTEYEEYRKKQALINEEYRKQQALKRQEEEQRKRQEIQKEANRRFEVESRLKQQLADALISGDREQYSNILKHNLRLNNPQSLILALQNNRHEFVKEYIDQFPSELSNHEVLFACLEHEILFVAIKDRLKSWHSKDRRDVLTSAVREGRTKVVVKLKDLDFNFNVRDNMGDSLLEIAKKNGHTDIVEFLKGLRNGHRL